MFDSMFAMKNQNYNMATENTETNTTAKNKFDFQISNIADAIW